MGIDKQSDIAANIQIGPTDQGMVRIYIEADGGIELPLDFDADEAEEIAEEFNEFEEMPENYLPPEDPAENPAEEPACSIPHSALRTPHLPLPPADPIQEKIARCLTPKPRRKNDFDIDMSESNPSRERGAAKRMLALAETMLPVLIDEINALYRSKLTLPTPPAGNTSTWRDRESLEGWGSKE